MAKISTLAGLFLLFWLAMSVGTLATEDEKSPSHKEMQKLIDDILDAEVAIEAGDFDKANAMVKEITEKLGDFNSLDKEKLAKFHEMLKIVEEAMKESNRDKAMAIIAKIGVNAKQQLGNGQQGADLKRELHEVSQSRTAEIIGHIKEATRAIERIDYDGAHKAIDTVYDDLKRDDHLLHDKKVLKFLRNMHEAEKDLRKESRSEALADLRNAARALGVPALRG